MMIRKGCVKRKAASEKAAPKKAAPPQQAAPNQIAPKTNAQEEEEQAGSRVAVATGGGRGRGRGRGTGRGRGRGGAKGGARVETRAKGGGGARGLRGARGEAKGGGGGEERGGEGEERGERGAEARGEGGAEARGEGERGARGDVATSRKTPRTKKKHNGRECPNVDKTHLAASYAHPQVNAWITVGYEGGPYYEACVTQAPICLVDGTLVYVTRTAQQREILFLWTPMLEWWPLDCAAGVPRLTQHWHWPSRVGGFCPFRLGSRAFTLSSSSSSSCSISCTSHPVRCGRLVEHFPYCPMHLDEVLGVRVGPSTIPGAGDGVFATRDLPKGWTLPYGGELVRRETIDKRYPEEGSEYVFEVSPSLLLDAQCKRGIGSMMNQPAKRKHPSGGFDRWCMDKQLRALQAGDTTHEDVCPVLFQLTRGVKKGAELFAPYGNAEWSREFDRAKAEAELDLDLGTELGTDQGAEFGSDQGAEFGSDQGAELGTDRGAELKAKDATKLQAACSRVKKAKGAKGVKGAKRSSRGQRGQTGSNRVKKAKVAKRVKGVLKGVQGVKEAK